MNDIEKKIANLTPEQRKVFEKWLQEKASASTEQVEKDLAENSDAPLTYAQQRLWFLHQFHQERNAYHILSAQRLRGRLNLEAFEKALDLISNRQKILQTIFDEWDGVVTQKFSKKISKKLEVVNLSHLSIKEREAAVYNRIARLGQDRMKMDVAPPWRCVLFHLQEDEFILLTVQHHIISDGWSLGVFYQELSRAYRSLVTGTDGSFPELPFQFNAYARKQQELGYNQYQDSLNYWKKHLIDVQALHLPLDYPRPKVFSYRGDSLKMSLSQVFSEKISAFCAQFQVTPFMVMISVFHLMLAEWSGQSNFLIGFPVSGREDADVENLIGLFVNTLLLRGGFDPEETYLDFLNRTREEVFSALTHQDCPFEMLVDELKPVRDTSRNPIFQVMFAFQNLPSYQLDLPRVASQEIHLERQTTRFDIECHIRQRDDHFIVEFVFNTDLFKSETISERLAHYQSLLENIIEQPHLDISRWLTSTPDQSLKNDAQMDDQVTQKPFEHPSDELELELRRLWQKILGIDQISIHDNYFDCGGTSLMALQLFAWIEKRLGCDLPISILFEAPTIAQLAQLIRGKGWSAKWHHLVMLRNQGGPENLYLIPPAGGTSFYFASLIKNLNFSGAIYSFDPAGMLDDSVPHQTIEEMAAVYLEDVIACQSEGPYQLGGMCFGGLVAYEMARLLEMKGHQVEILFLIDSLEPASGPDWQYEVRNLAYYQKRIRGLLREKKWMQAALKELRKPWLYFRNWIRPERELHSFFTHLIRIHNQAQTQYKAEPYRGKLDLLISEEFYLRENLISRWSSLVNGRLNVEVLAGSAHRDLLHKPEGLEFLVEKIEMLLTNQNELIIRE